MGFKGWDKGEILLKDGSQENCILPVIISASRATDIPAFFADWLANRLSSGYLLWTNPFNAKQRQYISFKNTRVIVFWSKNPMPLVKHLPILKEQNIAYYFQFTLNDYERENLEPNVPPLEERIETFQHLSELVGKQKMIWRFDPLVLTDRLSIDVLLEKVANVAERIKDYTEKLVISFADIKTYNSVQNNLNRSDIKYRDFDTDTMIELAAKLSEYNKSWGLHLASCAEDIDLSSFEIEHNRCIDDNLMIDLFSDDLDLMHFLGYEQDLFSPSSRPYLKDKGQRKQCGCIVSKDIGMYSTCSHLCTYCYANSSCKAVVNRVKNHDKRSESII